MSAHLEILETGPLALVQDLGRAGYTDIGVGMSGAADGDSFRLANRLVGNAAAAAAVEVTAGGLTVTAATTLLVAITGAESPISVDGRGAATNSTLLLRTGSVLRIGVPARGLRNYLAVRGGVDVEPVLGSRATDLLSGLGPPQLEPGTVLPVGTPAADLPAIDFAPVPRLPAETMTLRVVPGPRDDWFTSRALTNLLQQPYTVTTQSNRIGIRLHGAPLPRRSGAELPSEGMVSGAIQVPPSELPTLFLADHPVTGGYPVIAVVVSADVDKAAQARPGQTVRFVRTQPCGGDRYAH